MLYYMWLLHVQVLWHVLLWCLLVSPFYGDRKPSGITSIMRNHKRQKEAPVGAAHVRCFQRVTAFTQEVAEGEVITMLGFLTEGADGPWV